MQGIAALLSAYLQSLHLASQNIAKEREIWFKELAMLAAEIHSSHAGEYVVFSRGSYWCSGDHSNRNSPVSTAFTAIQSLLDRNR